MKYDARFKLKIVGFVKKSNNSSAGRHFDASEKLMRDWCKAENILRNMPNNKCVQTGKTFWPELEHTIFQWVIKVVTKKDIPCQEMRCKFNL